MARMPEFIDPGTITRLYDVNIEDVISAVSRRKVPSRMKEDGLVYVEFASLPKAAKALNWKLREVPLGARAA